LRIGQRCAGCSLKRCAMMRIAAMPVTGGITRKPYARNFAGEVSGLRVDNGRFWNEAIWSSDTWRGASSVLDPFSSPEKSGITAYH
jgi:hypothetical protein